MSESIVDFRQGKGAGGWEGRQSLKELIEVTELGVNYIGNVKAKQVGIPPGYC